MTPYQLCISVSFSSIWEVWVPTTAPANLSFVHSLFAFVTPATPLLNPLRQKHMFPANWPEISHIFFSPSHFFSTVHQVPDCKTLSWRCVGFIRFHISDTCFNVVVVCVCVFFFFPTTTGHKLVGNEATNSTSILFSFSQQQHNSSLA